MPSIHEICQQLKSVLELLQKEIGPTTLSYPGETPAEKAFYELSALYVTLLVGDRRKDD
jgi:hypothetical protein